MPGSNLAHRTGGAPKTRGGSAMLICLKCDQLTEPTSFRAEGSVVFAVCSQCSGEVQIGELSTTPPPRPRRSGPLAAVPAPAPEPAAVAPPPAPPAPLAEVITLTLEDLPVDPFAPPPSYCPKCIAPLGGGAMICAQCHLVPQRWNPGEVLPPGLLREPWKSLVSAWDRPDAHAAVIRLAERNGLLGELGRLYLIYLAQRPLDRLADQGLEEVSRLVATAQAEPAPPERTGLAVRNILVWVGLALAGWGGVALLARLLAH